MYICMLPFIFVSKMFVTVVEYTTAELFINIVSSGSVKIGIDKISLRFKAKSSIHPSIKIKTGVQYQLLIEINSDSVPNLKYL